MKRLLLLMAFVGLAPAAAAEVSSSDFPRGTVWYLHADLERMRSAGSGREMYRWLNGEIFVEINEELGIDLNREVDRVTAYSHDGPGTVIVVEGPLSRETKDKMLAVVTLEDGYDVLEHDGETYYFVGDEERQGANDGPLEDLDEAAYFTFAVDDKLIVTSREAELHALIESRGRITGSGSHDGALFVLTADKEFVQAGMRTEGFIGDGDDWDSNILRNTEEVAFLVSDSGGLLAIEARLKSRDARMAESIAGIVNGLMSLQLFNSELDPQLRTLIQSTRVEVDDTVLTVSTAFDPEALAGFLEEQ